MGFKGRSRTKTCMGVAGRKVPRASARLRYGGVEAIQRHVGSDFILCLDGHMGNQSEGEETWTIEIAKAVLKALEEYNIFFFEEPLPYRDPHGYVELCASTRMPAAGERTSHHFLKSSNNLPTSGVLLSASRTLPTSALRLL